MPSLKDYRDRIASVKSTRKITSAMKMVAASKLKRAQTQAEASQPYATRMGGMLARVVSNTPLTENSPVLLAGTGKDDVHLLIVVTSDRGLCGGFNTSVVRQVREKLKQIKDAGKEAKIICVGRKGRDQLRRDNPDLIVAEFEGPGKKGLGFSDADEVAQMVLDMIDREEFDLCSVIYNEFKSVIAQTPVAQQLVPFSMPVAQDNEDGEKAEEADEKDKAIYEFEPDEEDLLADLLPRNLAVQIFRAMLDSAAGEQAARMTAMDNATRNAGDMISKLTLEYNRARQAYITNELIEIISGAEAL